MLSSSITRHKKRGHNIDHLETAAPEIQFDCSGEGSLFLRGGEGGGRSVNLVIERAGQNLPGKDRRVFCRLCRLAITDERKAVEVNGLHFHTFFNPAGLVFEIACFADAAGCRQDGVFSNLFSWFAGTHWQVAVCRSCETHLGWFFQGQEMSFYGLIRNRLIYG